MRMDDDRLLTVAEACTWLNITDRTLRRWRQRHVLRAVTIGGVVRIRESELLRLASADNEESVDRSTGLLDRMGPPHR
jgi:excisionase family DNA binding protein